MSQLKLPWGETLHIESDIEQFSLDVMNLTAEFYVDMPDATLVVVRSDDFKLEDDTFVVRSCRVMFCDAWEEEKDPDKVEEIWQNFMMNTDPAHTQEGN